MASDHMMRASDTDRDAVVAVLRDAYAEGRLTLEEFGERTSASSPRTCLSSRCSARTCPAAPACQPAGRIRRAP
jgi:hypothetical protein